MEGLCGFGYGKKNWNVMVVSVRALHDQTVLLRNLKKVTKEMMAWVFNWLEKNSYRKSENDRWLQWRKSDRYMGNVYDWECVRYNNNKE